MKNLIILSFIFRRFLSLMLGRRTEAIKIIFMHIPPSTQPPPTPLDKLDEAARLGKALFPT